jgi:hypothetical protein
MIQKQEEVRKTYDGKKIRKRFNEQADDSVSRRSG